MKREHLERAHAVERAMEVAAIATEYAMLRDVYHYARTHPEVQAAAAKMLHSAASLYTQTASR